MTKFSFIIPFYGNITYNNNISQTLISLCNQTYKDVEIIVVGNKVIDLPLQIENDIEIRNIVINNEDRMGKLINEGVKVSQGEYLHIWVNDAVVHPDYLERLNSYIAIYGEDFLYAGRIIDTRGLELEHQDKVSGIFLKHSYLGEGLSCIHKKYFEPLNEEFKSYATHWAQEFQYRLWKKIRFIYMDDVIIIHIPHFKRLSPDEEMNSSKISNKIFCRLREINDR